MQQITIGTKNQVVIPKAVRRQIAGLKPGQKVSFFVLDQKTVAIKLAEDNWLERGFGLMKQAWKKNPIAQLEKMRDEWHG